MAFRHAGFAFLLALGGMSVSAQTNSMNDQARIEAYLGSEAKYNIVPVPTPLDRGIAVESTQHHLAERPHADEVIKLARLAIFHQLRETAAHFAALLTAPETSPDQVQRSCAALVAIVWIGEEGQIANAQRRFQELTRRADVERDQRPLLEAAENLGPVAVTQLRAVSTETLAYRQTELKELQRKPNAGAIHNLETRIDALEEFINLELPRADRLAKLVTDLRTQRDTRTAARGLVSLYLQEPPDATPLSAEWAARVLVRLPNPELIAAEFSAAATRREKIDPAHQAELDLGRARALRAARYFGATLSEQDSLWLAHQKDLGTDQLALRPDWEYPPPHYHDHAESESDGADRKK